MIRFDIEKMRSVYVYILKVTCDYVYVSSARSGLPYRETTTPQEKFRDYTVSKVKISRNVSLAFSKTYSCSEFILPRLASLNMYGEDIVSIEIQAMSAWAGGFQASENWQSFFSRSIPRLKEEIESIDDVWINGREVFWPKRSSTEFGLYQLDADGYLFLKRVEYVRLSSMGTSIAFSGKSRKQILEKALGNDDGGQSLSTERTVLKMSEGSVMAYRPNAKHPELEFIEVYSPVLGADDPSKLYSKRNNDGMLSEERKAFAITNQNNPAYANIEFAIRAAQTLGKLYGHHHADAIDIPRIIAQTGFVFLTDIDEVSRRKVPVHMTAMYCLGLIFGYIHRETELNKIRELSQMFRYCIKNGLVYEKEIDNDFLETAPSKSIPLVSD